MWSASWLAYLPAILKGLCTFPLAYGALKRCGMGGRRRVRTHLDQILGPVVRYWASLFTRQTFIFQHRHSSGGMARGSKEDREGQTQDWSQETAHARTYPPSQEIIAFPDRTRVSVAV